MNAFDKILDAIDRLKNCGIGSGGFQPGNQCASGGSGGGGSSSGGKEQDKKSMSSMPPGSKKIGKDQVWTGRGSDGFKVVKETKKKFGDLGYKKDEKRSQPYDGNHGTEVYQDSYNNKVAFQQKSVQISRGKTQSQFDIILTLSSSDY